MGWTRVFVLFLAVLEAGWMVFDGGRALVVGDYVTMPRGPHAGQLGPWASVVEAMGIAPRSVPMKLIFVVYGVTYLFLAWRYAQSRPWSRAGMLAAALGSLWYVGVATPMALTQIILLILLPTPSPHRPD